MKTDLFLIMSILVSLSGCSHTAPTHSPTAEKSDVELNDVHSQLNATKHTAIITPKSLEEIQSAVREAKANGQFISISGGKQSMGGQQFATGTVNLRRLSVWRLPVRN